MTKENEKRVPKLRFKGFTDDWEQRKLSDISTINARIGWQNLRTSEFLDNGEYLLITGTDFKDGKIDYSNIHYIGKERYDQDKNIQIKNGSILITKDGTLGKVAYVEDLRRPATLNAGVFNVQVTKEDEINSKYLFHYLRAPFLLKYAASHSTGGTIKHLNKNILVDFPIPIPVNTEQIKIATFLSNIKKAITLHQRKLEQLEQLKQALLQQMFLGKDEVVPKLRFTNFQDDWEQRKLGESLKVIDGDRGINYPHESDFFQSGYTLFLNTGNVTKNGFNFATIKYITKEKDEQLRAGRLEKNDFVLTSRGTLGNIGFYNHKIHTEYPRVRINSAMLILRNMDKQLSYSYLHSVLKGKLISDFMKKNQVGSAQPHITKTEFLKLNLSIPGNIKEQDKIGNFFNNIEKTIALHQQKLENLKLIKQSLLQHMFI